MYATLNDNPTEISGHNIDENETELTNLREEKLGGLIIRAKAKWSVEERTSTNYFCSLEKCHYIENLTLKLILENVEITHLSHIFNEQAKFSKSLYQTNINVSRGYKLFFDKTNSFLNYRQKIINIIVKMPFLCKSVSKLKQ